MVTQRARVLKMLEDAGPHGVRSDAFLAAYMPRAAARVLELKDEGYEIETEREGKYVRYTLAGMGTVGGQTSSDGGVHSGEKERGGEGRPVRSVLDAGPAPSPELSLLPDLPARSSYMDPDTYEAA